MTTDVTSKEIPVLCEYDALFAAIELKLSALPQVRVVRLPSAPVHRCDGRRKFDLIIVAPVPPVSDPMSVLARAALLNCVGQVPVLIISEQPSRPESDDMITFLNFPYDMDDLTNTVEKILGKSHRPGPEHAS